MSQACLMTLPQLQSSFEDPFDDSSDSPRSFFNFVSRADSSSQLAKHCTPAPPSALPSMDASLDASLDAELLSGAFGLGGDISWASLLTADESSARPTSAPPDLAYRSLARDSGLRDTHSSLRDALSADLFQDFSGADNDVLTDFLRERLRPDGGPSPLPVAAVLGRELDSGVNDSPDFCAEFGGGALCDDHVGSLSKRSVAADPSSTSPHLTAAMNSLFGPQSPLVSRVGDHFNASAAVAAVAVVSAGSPPVVKAPIFVDAEPSEWQRNVTATSSNFAEAVHEMIVAKSYRGEVSNMALQDQMGCRLLQAALDQGDSETAREISLECIEHMPQLMTDPFGNYLGQKVVQLADSDTLTRIVKRVSRELVQISLNIHGTRAVQKLIERAETRLQKSLLLKGLFPGVVALATDLNGNHVIQKCLSTFSPLENKFIFDAIISNCAEVAMHRHGCCVLQRCIDRGHEKQAKAFCEEIARNALELVQDAFGNYVVQYVVNRKDQEVNREIVDGLKAHVFDLSRQKFSSNVIEKCLATCGVSERNDIVKALASGGPQQVKELMLDPFGNYVIQHAMDVTPQEFLGVFLEGVRLALPALRQTVGGKRIALKLAKRFPVLSASGIVGSPTARPRPQLSPPPRKGQPGRTQQQSPASPSVIFTEPKQRSRTRQSFAQVQVQRPVAFSLSPDCAAPSRPFLPSWNGSFRGAFPQGVDPAWLSPPSHLSTVSFLSGVTPPMQQCTVQNCTMAAPTHPPHQDLRSRSLGHEAALNPNAFNGLLGGPHLPLAPPRVPLRSGDLPSMPYVHAHPPLTGLFSAGGSPPVASVLTTFAAAQGFSSPLHSNGAVAGPHFWPAKFVTLPELQQQVDFSGAMFSATGGAMPLGFR